MCCIFQKVANLILGVHPNNTCFSFNWHNVRHINSFLRRKSFEIEKNSMIIADIGGGRSPYFSCFSNKAGKFIVVDLEEALPKNEERPIIQLKGVAENIPLNDNSVDIVLCNQVLEHVTDPVKSVREIHRILRSGGYFMGSVPHVSPIHLEPYDFRRYTSLGVEHLLKKEGFSEIVIEGSGGVFSAAVLMILMDLLLSERKDGESQNFNSKLSLLIFPVTGFFNLLALFADRIIRDKKRTPANLCWCAIKK